VCDNYWDDYDARVLCMMLGLPYNAGIQIIELLAGFKLREGLSRKFILVNFPNSIILQSMLRSEINLL